MENLENNETIAEFMGIEEAYNPNGNDWVLKTTIPNTNGDTDILESCKSNELKYHTSWDWLMPVVETCYHNGADSNEIGDITHALLDCDIDNTYKAVVEFIKIYNKKQKESMTDQEQGGSGVVGKFTFPPKTDKTIN